ncbi:hypothetical protein F4777DRAFT_17384 [Nemania sp. FL0916]|nr:hypothetical protein F4777DRAFT_17384 [Nemania sp. FL0916]
MSAIRKAAPTVAAQQSKPQILLISYNLQSFFDEEYAALLAKLASRASLKRVTTSAAILAALAEQPPSSAVLITDESLTRHQNRAIWKAVLQYVRQGGTAVCMGHFSPFVTAFETRPFFARAGLPWEMGDYLRTTVVLHEAAVGRDVAASLEPRYSLKAMFLKNVAPEDTWYCTDEASLVESGTPPPMSAHRVGEAAVALARVGDGKLGYVGDTNTETGSDLVVLAMCGLAG